MSDNTVTVHGMNTRYHPWARIARRTGIHVHFTDNLPAGIDGATDGHSRIWIRRGLTQAQRRSVLAHEIVHIERGLDIHPLLESKEEEAVERLAARRLIGLDELADALLWHGGRVHHGVAEDLWVDLALVEARLRALTDAERAELVARFDRLESTA